MKSLFSTFFVAPLLVSGFLASKGFAESCPTGKFKCNVDHTHSTTCCSSDQVCGVSDHGQAECTIPKASDRTPSKLELKRSSPKKTVKKQSLEKH